MDRRDKFEQYLMDVATPDDVKIAKKRRLDNLNILFVVNDTSTTTTTFPAANEPGLRSDVGDETICDMIARQVTGQPWREYDFLEIVGGDVNAADGGGN